MAKSFADTLKLELVLTQGQFASLAETITPKDTEVLAQRFDRWMFGKKGSLSRSIKAQTRDNANWKPLSKRYHEWKVRMKKTKRPIPGEPPPNIVISDKIWIRTGKVRQFTETTGNGAFKTMRVFPQNLLSGRPFYEVFAKNIQYWQYPDKARRLMFFTDDDKRQMNIIFKNWLDKVVIRRMSRGRVAA